MNCNNLEKCIIDNLNSNAINDCQGNSNVCIKSSDKRTYVKCEENRKIYNYKNISKKHIISYKIDGGVIQQSSADTEGQARCDYLYIINNMGGKINTIQNSVDAILIELKGVNIGKAIKQIEATLNLFKNVFDKCEHVYGRVVMQSGFGPMLYTTPDYVRVRKKIEKYNGNLKFKEIKYDDDETMLGQM